MSAAETQAASPELSLDEAASRRLTFLAARAAGPRGVTHGAKRFADHVQRAMAALEAEYDARRAVLERDQLLADKEMDEAARLSQACDRALQTAVVQALSAAGVKPEDMGYYSLRHDSEGTVVGFVDRRKDPPPTTR